MFPKVSIIVPTLGRPEGLKRCLDSIVNLNYPKSKIEIIVIEDVPRLGVPKRVKEGVEKSSGSFIVFASNDMEFEKNCLLEALRETKALVAFNSGEVYPDGGNICEHFIIRKDFIAKIGGEIFDTEFNHLGVDNLLWAKCLKLNEATRSERAVIHHHHFTKGATFDKVYAIAWEQELAGRDRELLRKKLEQLNETL